MSTGNAAPKAGNNEAPEVSQRFRGYSEALTEARLRQDPDLAVACHFTMESAQASVETLLARDVAFDGIVAASDVIALGALRALQKAGRDVPGDVSVVGYDDVPFARFSRPRDRA